ncbi:guanitoxin biosynthesis heme-dependent pre-guanitoxin N-hydroxylase GntA [Hymenobacter sp. DG25B]|uniref:guanitoxin biosynthesis heme-dependent pre-guanitoxin N-hydroxylase GntA n=1 Tax=Hymenobacter sp. DG25B TaxID=1385664 RepID=UPI0005C9FB56|nr:guanitoxin biosynthesis heme-dependent pre-guanitoxin N-hydroxylase GntA [Hymenobacter sp. DG25B]
MTEEESNIATREYFEFIQNREFPCVAAKTALTWNQIKCLVVDHLACPKDDAAILEFIYDFVDTYRTADKLYHSAAIIFKGPENPTEAQFEEFFWQRLQAVSNLDSQRYGYDPRVVADPNSPDFSYSLKEEAFFVIGLHPGSSRPARQFKCPTLVFNAHDQFERIREAGRYDNLRQTIRTRDVVYSGSINPMLEDYGQSSEVYQYSGKAYDQAWKCPFLSQHVLPTNHHSAA